MRVTYDGRANAAYIYLKSAIGPGEVAKTYVCDLKKKGLELAADINLDFDVSGRLIGIEVLYASHGLPRDLLEQAEVIG